MVIKAVAPVLALALVSVTKKIILLVVLVHGSMAMTQQSTGPYIKKILFFL
jgi:hypothetical protein